MQVKKAKSDYISTVPEPPYQYAYFGIFSYFNNLLGSIEIETWRKICQLCFLLFQLKPYVSYKVSDIKQSEFTAKDLFDALYSKNVIEDWRDGKLNENDPNSTYLKPKGS